MHKCRGLVQCWSSSFAKLSMCPLTKDVDQRRFKSPQKLYKENHDKDNNAEASPMSTVYSCKNSRFQVTDADIKFYMIKRGKGIYVKFRGWKCGWKECVFYSVQQLEPRNKLKSGGPIHSVKLRMAAILVLREIRHASLGLHSKLPAGVDSAHNMVRLLASADADIILCCLPLHFIELQKLGYIHSTGCCIYPCSL